MSNRVESSVRPKYQRQFYPPIRHLAAIGAVAAAWTMIESTMELTILGLYEIDQGRGLVLTNNIGFPARLSLLRILASEGAIADKDRALEMLEILKRIEAAYGDRNALLHGLWAKGDKPGVIRRLALRTRKNKLQTYAEDFTADQLWDVVERMRSLEIEFADLAARSFVWEKLESATRHSTAPK